MGPVYRLEQMNSSTFEFVTPDARTGVLADKGAIALNLARRQRTHMQCRGIAEPGETGITADDGDAGVKLMHATAQSGNLPGKTRHIDRFVQDFPVMHERLVCTDHDCIRVPRRHLLRLRFGKPDCKLQRILPLSQRLLLKLAFINSSRNTQAVQPRGFEQLPARRACGSKDEGLRATP